MNYYQRMDEFLKENLTERCYCFWTGMNTVVPTVWDRPSSSTRKYHRKEDGRVPSIAEHTYEMLIACSKVMRSFDIELKTKDSDSLLLSICFHDFFKYGYFPEERSHTDKKHDKLSADIILKNKDSFLKFLSEDQFSILEEAVRFHSGKWSSDADKDFNFSNLKPTTLFIHMLDMLSTNNVLNTEQI